MADLYQVPNPTRSRPAANFGAGGFDSDSHPRGDDGKFTKGGGGGGGSESGSESKSVSKLDAGGRAKALKSQIDSDPLPPSDDRRAEVLQELQRVAKSTGKPPKWWAALRKLLGVGYKKGLDS